MVEQHTGQVKIVEPSGLIQARPFLEVTGLATGNEQGLLSIAFAPDYAATGTLFAFLTPPGKVEIREYRRTATDPARAEPTGRTLFSADHPRSNHNGGLVTFGPDGQLWFGVGDGGGANDPDANGQNTSTPLGKLHRVDAASFGSAAGNPFGTVFAYGLRNPWRFSFDRAIGDLIVADVGQGEREEVDFAAAPGRNPGTNYGWRCWEGTIRTPGVTPCEAPGHVPPVHELRHDDGACSITGGVVVRDPGVPSLAGRYLYGDICKGQLRSITLPGAGDDRAEPTLPVAQVTDLAEDACGRVVVSSLEGSVHRLVEGAPTGCDFPPPGTTGPPPGGTPAPATCGLSVRALRARRAAVLRRGLPVRVGVRSACRVSATARIRRVGTLVARTRTLVAGQRVTLRLRAGRRTRARLRRRASALAVLTLRASTPAGATERRQRRIIIRR